MLRGSWVLKINIHECKLPRIHQTRRIGSIWKCRRCKMMWRFEGIEWLLPNKWRPIWIELNQTTNLNPGLLKE